MTEKTEENVFTALSNSFENLSPEGAEPKSGNEPSVEETPEATPTDTPAATEAPPAETPTPTAEAVEPPTSPPEQSTEQPKPAEPPATLSPEEYQKKVNEVWDKFRSQAQEQYLPQIPEEHFIEDGQRQALANLLSLVQTNTYGLVLNYLNQQAVPLIQQVIQSHNSQNQLEQNFYNQFPGLQKQEYQQDIVNAVTNFRNQNPDLSVEDLIQRAGAFVAISKGLPLEEVQGKKTEHTPTTPPSQPPVASPAAVPLSSLGATPPPEERKRAEDNTQGMFGDLTDGWLQSQKSGY